MVNVGDTRTASGTRGEGGGGEVAKGKKRSLAARGLALLFALALVALAAKLWLGYAPREDATGESVATELAGAADDTVSAGPPQHGEIDAEDRAALRDILRDSQTEPE